MILDLHRQGVPISDLARRVGLDGKTGRKYIARGLEPPVYKRRAPGPLVIDGFALYLRERVAAFPGLSGRRLWRDLRELGFAGSYSSVTGFLHEIRPAAAPVFERRFAGRRRGLAGAGRAGGRAARADPVHLPGVAADRGRDQLPAGQREQRQPVLPAGQRPLRAWRDDPDIQPGLLGNGTKCSATAWWRRRCWIVCCTTRRLCRSRDPATACVNTPTSCRRRCADASLPQRRRPSVAAGHRRPTRPFNLTADQPRPTGGISFGAFGVEHARELRAGLRRQAPRPYQKNLGTRPAAAPARQERSSHLPKSRVFRPRSRLYCQFARVV